MKYTEIEEKKLPKKTHYLIKLIDGEYKGQHLTLRLYRSVVLGVDLKGRDEYAFTFTSFKEAKKVQKEFEDAINELMVDSFIVL